MAKFKNICVVTGSRAEYGLLRWIMEAINNERSLTLQTVVTGMHLSETFGLTYREIEKDGFSITAKIPLPLEDESEQGAATALSAAITGFSKTYDKIKPDVILVLGDRTEILGACLAALIHRIPIAHIHGGEVTQGAFDDAIRHSISKMAFLHFPAAEEYKQRLMQMGENPDHIHVFGAPGLENFKRLTLLDKKDLEQAFGYKLGKINFLVTYHPVTLEKETSKKHMQELLSALDAFPDAHLFFTYPNSDPDNLTIRQMLEGYVAAKPDSRHATISLGQTKYLSLMKCCNAVIGNSSSGIIEAPAAGTPTVNIGDRQKGRLLASSIISCVDDRTEIINSIKKVTTTEFKSEVAKTKNPYQSDETAGKIIGLLKTFDFSPDNLKKKFFDLPITS